MAAPGPSRCCDSDIPCVFAKALLSRNAECGLAERRAVGEQMLLECPDAQARGRCAELADLMHERARFALRLPPRTRPLMHMQALRLQCGGLQALRQQQGGESRDVHAMVAAALNQHMTLQDLPWAELVSALVAWQAPQRGRPRS